MDAKNANVLQVVWHDSHHVSGWTKIKNLPKCAGKKSISIGIEIQNTDKAITLALSYGENLPQVQGVIIIPKNTIESSKLIAVINLNELFQNEGVIMSVLNVVVISALSEDKFEKEVHDFLNLNEDMIELNKTVYGITQEHRQITKNYTKQYTKYSAIFQMEGQRRK